MNAERHSRIRAVFHQVCDLDPQQQRRILDRECAGDMALRLEVAALLQRDIDDGPFFEPLFDGTDLLAESLTSVPRETPKSIAGYDILDVLGEGGMGIVYRARHPRTQGVVALKVMRSGLPTPEDEQRFELEMLILGQLKHPGIAQVYDADTYLEGVHRHPFFAMELVDGVPLLRHVKDVGQVERLDLFRSICAVVQYAHEEGIVHRDLKPGNILVQRDGQVKLIDFGIARLSERESSAELTRPGQMLGTLQYMSPEQVKGDSVVDARSDIYALGITLFELLTGKVPHDLEGKTPTEAARVIVEDTIQRPSVHDRRLRGDLDAIILKSVEKHPAHRYQSVQQLIADVSRYLEGTPVHARPVSRMIRTLKWVRRHPSKTLLLLLTSSICLTATTHALWTIASARSSALKHATTGDLLSLRTELQRLPTWTDIVLLPDSLASSAAEMRSLSGDRPVVQVLRELHLRGEDNANLLAARFIERDGISEQSLLASFLLRGLRGRDTTSALPLVAHLFFDRPDASEADCHSSAGFRDSLHSQAAGTLSPGIASYLIVALSGCGNEESIGIVRAMIEVSIRQDPLPQSQELLRLGTWCLESILRRLAANTRPSDRMYGEEAEQLVASIDDLAEEVRRRSDDAWFAYTGMEALVLTLEFVRRSGGLAPMCVQIHPQTSPRILAARQDPALREQLTNRPTRFLGVHRTAAKAHNLGFMLEASGVGSGEVDQRAIKTWALSKDVDLDALLEQIRLGRESARRRQGGLHAELEPDEDTQLGAYFQYVHAPFEAISVERATTERGGLALWDFRSKPPTVAGTANGASCRATIFGADENVLDQYFARLGIPQLSMLTLPFSLPPSDQHVVILEIQAVKGKRRLLPYNGTAFILVRVDGVSLGEYRIDTDSGDHIEVPLTRRNLGPGQHVLDISLTQASNTTVRIEAVSFHDP